MKSRFPFFHRPAFSKGPAAKKENSENRHVRDVSQDTPPSPNVQSENARKRRHFPSRLQMLFLKEKKPGMSASTVVSASAAASHRNPTLNELYLANEIAKVEEQATGAVVDFFSKTSQAGKDTLTANQFNSVMAFYKNHAFNELDEKFIHVLKNIDSGIVDPELSPEKVDRIREEARERVVESLGKAAHEQGWVLPRKEESNLEWEVPSMPLLIKSGFSLQKIKLDKEGIASGGFGSVSIFENEKHAKLIGKIAKRKIQNESGNIRNEISDIKNGLDKIENGQTNIKNELSNIKNTLSDIENEIVHIENGSTDIRKNPEIIKKKLFNIKSKLMDIKDGKIDIKNEIDSIKMDLGKIKDDLGNTVDSLADELAGYKAIYDAVGPHPNLLNAYGIARVPYKDGEMKRVLLTDIVPGPTGTDVFDALRKSWHANKISSAEYWGAIQFIGKRLLDVTEHMGKAGVVHNDIKPENFLVNEKTGEPVLIDMGLFSVKGEKYVGRTPGFNSPEASLKQGVDERSDVFTVGASLVDGVEAAIRDPNKGLFKRQAYKDREGNLVRQQASYAVETAYTKFISRLLEEDKENRVNSKDAKGLDFLQASMLDDSAAKKAIRDAISNAREEAKKPIKEQWKRARPQVALSEERRDNAQRMLEEFKNKPDLVGYARLRNERKAYPDLRKMLDKGGLEDFRWDVEQDVARHAEEFVAKASWFNNVERISEKVSKTIKAGVDKDGKRLENTDQNRDKEYKRSVIKARQDLIFYAKADDLRLYADEAEAFLREAGTLRGGMNDPKIEKLVQQVRERAAVARRMVEIVETDFSSSKKHEDGNIRDRALELERQLRRRR